MAASSTNRRDDEDALDPVEAADEEHLDNPIPDDALIEGEDVADVFDDEDELAEEADEVLGASIAAESDTPEAAALSDFDDEPAVVAVVDDDPDDEDDDLSGIRDGEFVCRSCYMAKRDTQLADADAMLCRDCA